jgi:hypothetical protein
MSSNFTILGWENSLNIDISLITVEGTPSLSIWLFIFFKATVSPVYLSSALNTSPYAPSPSISSL